MAKKLSPERKDLISKLIDESGIRRAFYLFPASHF